MKLNYVFTILFFLSSCVEEKKVIPKFDFQDSRTFLQFLDQDNADRKNYIVTVLGTPKCDLCGYVKENMSKFSGMPSNVLFRSVDLTKIENKWMGQLLREFSYPLILITDTENKLVGFVKGARLNVLRDAFQNTLNDRIFFDDGNGLFLNQYETTTIESVTKIDFLNTQLQSYIRYVNKENLGIDELRHLESSVDSYPYFLNTYLLYQFTKDRNLLNRLMNEYNTTIDQFLYTGLKKSLISTDGKETKNDVGANLMLNNSFIRFGEGRLSDKRNVTVKVKNKGVRDLILTDIVPSCNCVTVSWDRKPIPPGEERSVEIAYELRSVGNYIQQVTFFSNVMEEPAVFTIEGVVKNK